MTDFLRFAAYLYSDPQWNETPAGTQAALSQNNASFVQNYTPRQIQFNPEDSAQFTQQFRQQTQSGERDLRALETLLNQFQSERNQTSARIPQMNGMSPEAKVQLIDQVLSQNDRVLGISFLRLERIVRENNLAELPRALQQYNEAFQNYLQDHRAMETNHANRVPEDTVKDVYDLILQPTLSLMSLLNSRLSSSDRNNEAIRNTLRRTTQNIQEAWQLMANTIPVNPSSEAYEGDARNFGFLREFAQGQSELIQIVLNEDSNNTTSNADLLIRARQHLESAQRGSQEIVNRLHPAQDSDLEYFTSIVSSTAPRHSQSLPPLPTAPEAARQVITSNTLSFISTICQEIDQSHRTAAEVISLRYTRFQMVMNSLLAVQPGLNLREAMNRLQNLRWNDELYNHMQQWIGRRNQEPAHANNPISYQDVITALEQDNHPLRQEVIRQIQTFVQRNQNNPHHQNISTQNLNDRSNGALTLLKGSQTLHAMLPLLARSLHGALSSMPANSPDRLVLLNFFRSTAERHDLSREPLELGKQEIVMAVLNGREPSARSLEAFRATGQNARNFVNHLIEFITHRSSDPHQAQENLRRAQSVQVYPGLSLGGELNQNMSRLAANDPEILREVPEGIRNKQVPAWLRALQTATYTEPTRPTPAQNNQNIIRDLGALADSLESGRLMNESDSNSHGYERNYGNLIAFVSHAGGNGGIRNTDGAHLDSDLEHIQRILRTDNTGLFDDSHQLLDDLLQADQEAVRTGDPVRGVAPTNLGALVSSWAERILNRIHHYDNAWAANAIHRNERHPASFRVIWNTLAGSTQQAGDAQHPESLAHQLASYHLADSTLAASIQQRAQTELNTGHGFRDFMMAFGTVDNLALTGVMAGSTQLANRAIQGSEAVAAGTRVGLSEYLLQSAARMRWYNPARWVTRIAGGITRWSGRHPVTAAFAFSGFAGYQMASVRDQRWRVYNNEHPNDRHDFNLYEDWARNTATLFGISSALWYPSYFNRMRNVELWGYRPSGALRFLAPYNWDWRVRVGASAAAMVAGAAAINHFRPHHSRLENMVIGAGGAFLVFSPLALSAHPRLIQLIEGGWGGYTGAGAMRLGTVAENGQLGFAGHMLTGGAAGLAGGVAGAGLIYARDGVNGYETHFWEDFAQSGTSLGVAMTANAAVGALYSLPGRAIRRFQTRRIADAQAAELARAEREIQAVINRGRWAQAGTGLVHSLASASVATVGMLVAESEMHALEHHRLAPNGSDLGAAFTPEGIATTYANMLAFEGMNAGMSRIRIQNLLGRPRSTQIDHVANRLLQDVRFANAAERNATREFVWRRLAIESLRGRDLSQIAREDNIRQWQANFNNGRVRLDPRGTDPSSHTSIPNPALGETIDALASQALVYAGEASPPDVTVYIDRRDGSITHETPENMDNHEGIQLGFSGRRVHLSEDTQTQLRRLATQHPALDRVAAELLARHGAPIALHPVAVTVAEIIRGVRQEALRDSTSLFVTESEGANRDLRNVQDVQRALHEEQGKDHPDANRLRQLGEQMNLFIQRRLLARVEVGGQMYDLYRGTLETVPEGRRRHSVFEMTIPGTHNPNPTIRPGRVQGLYDRWRTQPNQEPIHIRSRKDQGQWNDLPEAWRNLLHAFETNAQAGQAIHLNGRVTGSTATLASSLLEDPHAVYHVGDSRVINARSFNSTVRAWLPDGLEMALERRGEHDWVLHNFSTQDVTLQVNGNDVRRNGQFIVNHGDVIRIPAGESTAADGSRTARFVEITLDLNHTGAASVAPPPPPPPPPPPVVTTVTATVTPGGTSTATPATTPRSRRHLPVIQNNTGTAPVVVSTTPPASPPSSPVPGTGVSTGSIPPTVRRYNIDAANHDIVLEDGTRFHVDGLDGMGPGALRDAIRGHLGDSNLNARLDININTARPAPPPAPTAPAASGVRLVLYPRGDAALASHQNVVRLAFQGKVYVLPEIRDGENLILSHAEAPELITNPNARLTLHRQGGEYQLSATDPDHATDPIFNPDHETIDTTCSYSLGSIDFRIQLPEAPVTPVRVSTPPPAPVALADWGTAPVASVDPTEVIGNIGATARACSNFMDRVPRNDTVRYAVYEVRLGVDGHVAAIDSVTDNAAADISLTQGQMLFQVGGSEAIMIRRANLPHGIRNESRDFLNQMFVADPSAPEPTMKIATQVMEAVGRALHNNDALTRLIRSDLTNGTYAIVATGDRANPFRLETIQNGSYPRQFAAILDIEDSRVSIRSDLSPTGDLREIIDRVVRQAFQGRTIAHGAFTPPPLPPSGGPARPGGPGTFPPEPAPVAPGEANAGANRERGANELPELLADFFAEPPGEAVREEPASPARLEEARVIPAAPALGPSPEIAQWPPYAIAPEQVPQTPDAVFSSLRGLRADPHYSQSQERLLIPTMLEGAHAAFTRPTRAVQVEGYTFFLSPLIRSESRDYVLGMVPVRENGHFVLKRRIFYKSLSDGTGWRCPPYVANGHLGKGSHYVASTQVVPALAEALDQILAERGVRSSDSSPDLSPEDFANFRDLGTPLQRFTVGTPAAGAELGTFIAHPHPRPAEQVRISFLEELSRYRPAHVFSYNNAAIQGAGYGPYKAIDAAKAEQQVQDILALNSRYPEGFIPNFTQTPLRTHTTQHPYLGAVTLRDYPAVLQTATGQRPLIWTMAQDNQGRTWCANIRYADSPINSYGVPSEIFDGGVLISKPLEYDEQVAGLPERYRRPINNPVTGEQDYTYTDMTPFLHELEPIRRFRIAQGLEGGTANTAQAGTSSMQLRTQNSEMQEAPEEEVMPEPVPASLVPPAAPPAGVREVSGTPVRAGEIEETPPTPTAEALPPTRVRPAEPHVPIAGHVSLTRRTYDDLQSLLRNQGIAVPDTSFLQHIMVGRGGVDDSTYLFRTDGNVQFTVTRQRGLLAGRPMPYGNDAGNFSGLRHVLGEIGESVVIQSGGEAYTLTLQAPERAQTSPRRTYQGPGYFSRAARALETWWASLNRPAQSPAPDLPPPPPARHDLRMEIPVVIGAPEQSWTLGRNPANQIVLSSRVVAREQARIIRLNGEYFIEDLSNQPGRSTPRLTAEDRGTYVEAEHRQYGDDHWIPCDENQARIPLRVGQRIGFGSPHAASDSVRGSMEIYTFELDRNGNPRLRSEEVAPAPAPASPPPVAPATTGLGTAAQAPAPVVAPEFSVTTHPQIRIAGQTVDLNMPSDGFITLGRSGGGAAIELLPLPSISRGQALLEHQVKNGTSHYLLYDGSYDAESGQMRPSANGTYIVRQDGSLIPVPADLNQGIELLAGDVIHVGNPQSSHGSITHVSWLSVDPAIPHTPASAHIEAAAPLVNPVYTQVTRPNGSGTQSHYNVFDLGVSEGRQVYHLSENAPPGEEGSHYLLVSNRVLSPEEVRDIAQTSQAPADAEVYWSYLTQNHRLSLGEVGQTTSVYLAQNLSLWQGFAPSITGPSYVIEDPRHPHSDPTLVAILEAGTEGVCVREAHPDFPIPVSYYTLTDGRHMSASATPAGHSLENGHFVHFGSHSLQFNSAPGSTAALTVSRQGAAPLQLLQLEPLCRVPARPSTQIFASMPQATPTDNAAPIGVAAANVPEEPALIPEAPVSAPPLRLIPLVEYPAPPLPTGRRAFVDFPLRTLSEVFENRTQSSNPGNLLRVWQQQDPHTAPSTHSYELGRLQEITIQREGDRYTFTPPRNLHVAIHVEAFDVSQHAPSHHEATHDHSVSIAVRPGTRVWLSLFNPRTGELGDRSICLTNSRVN